MSTVEVFADIWCPFTHVGLRRLLARREEVGIAIRIRVRAWPLELVNGTPLDSHFVAEEVTELRSEVAPDLFAGFDEDGFPTTTLPALALVESAYEAGQAKGEAMSLTLRDALFEKGRNISDPAVLEEIARALDVPAAGAAHERLVRESWDEGRTRAVIGSPHFFTDGGGFFCPALDIERVDGQLRISLDPPAFEAFVASCFET